MFYFKKIKNNKLLMYKNIYYHIKRITYYFTPQVELCTYLIRIAGNV